MPDPTKPEIIVPPSQTSKLDLQTRQQIERLQNHSIVELEMVQQFHTWLDDKRQCRQACRVVGDSRTGKTVACNAYRHKHSDQRMNGDAPIVPVMYLHAPTESGPRELFVGLLEYLQYRITRGTISDLRDRVYRLLKMSRITVFGFFPAFGDPLAE